MTELLGPSFRCRAATVVAIAGAGDAAKVLLLQRAKEPLSGCWCLITGKIEPGEPAWRTALREASEEAGLKANDLWTADYCDTFYNPVDDRIEVIPVFVLRYAVPPQVRLNHESADFDWVQIDTAPDRVPFNGHRSALKAIRSRFLDREPMPWMRIHLESDYGVIFVSENGGPAGVRFREG